MRSPLLLLFALASLVVPTGDALAGMARKPISCAAPQAAECRRGFLHPRSLRKPNPAPAVARPATAGTGPSRPRPSARAAMGRELLRRGMAHAARSDWDKALARLRAARAYLPDLAKAQRVEVALLLGLCYANLLDRERARQFFEQALLLNPCARLPGLDLAPGIVRSFRALRKRYKLQCAAKRPKPPKPNPDSVAPPQQATPAQSRAPGCRDHPHRRGTGHPRRRFGLWRPGAQ